MLGATDFTTIEVWTRGGLVAIYLLFVLEVGTRRVHFAGSTTNPTEPWMKQVARNLTDSFDGFLLGSRYLIMDRDTKFCESFLSILRQADVDPVKLPARSPNLNAHQERFIRSLKNECLNRLIETDTQIGCVDGKVVCRERLGRLLLLSMFGRE